MSRFFTVAIMVLFSFTLGCGMSTAFVAPANMQTSNEIAATMMDSIAKKGYPSPLTSSQAIEVLNEAFEKLGYSYSATLRQIASEGVSIGNPDKYEFTALLLMPLIVLKSDESINTIYSGEDLKAVMEISRMLGMDTKSKNYSPHTSSGGYTYTKPEGQFPQTSSSGYTHSVSFDCSKAIAYVEKEICSDSLLGRLDGVLAQNYKYMLAADIGDGAKKELKATQKNWLASRNKCTTNSCLVEAYRGRVDAICDYPVISGIHPACTYSSEIN